MNKYKPDKKYIDHVIIKVNCFEYEWGKHKESTLKFSKGKFYVYRNEVERIAKTGCFLFGFPVCRNPFDPLAHLSAAFGLPK